MNQFQRLPSQTETKYNNARIALVLIVVFSLINIVSLVTLDTYFFFSAYIPLMVAAYGYAFYVELGIAFIAVVGAVISALLVLPYLLCAIFSKKRVGWTIAALVLFSVDSLFFLVDFVMLAISGEMPMLFDLIFRFWAMVSLILGVKYGLQMKKEAAAAPAVIEEVGAATAEESAADTTRTLMVTRKKSFIGCAVPLIVYVNGAEVCRLKNGESQTLAVTCAAFSLGGALTSGLVSGQIPVEGGSQTLHYVFSMKAGLMANTLEISRME